MTEPRPAALDDVKAGVERPIAVNYRMALVGAVTLYDEKGEPVSTIRHAHVAEGRAASMEASFRRDLDVLLRRSGDLRVVTLADGAPEMQNILDRATADVTVSARIVNFYHCVEHLAAAIAATGRRVPDLRADWKGDLLTKTEPVETARDLSQGDLAAATRQTINVLEQEKYAPSLELAVQIAGAFGLGSEEVWTFEDGRLHEPER